MATNSATASPQQMPTPYYLGCPQWQDVRWNHLLPPGESPLARYSQVFPCVEGNTTFYATPSQAQCRRWRSQVPDDFRFLFKFPRTMTHDRLLETVDSETRDFLERLAPLKDVLGPFLLQLPPAFGPARLDSLWRFLDSLPDSLSCTVEVRHPDFFAKGDGERHLNRGLRERRTSRVCLDSRGLFEAAPKNAIIRDAQKKKPNHPIHLLPVEAPPVIRYVGHPDLAQNERYLVPWVERVAGWIEQNRRPFVFMHMPDNGDALALASLWTALLQERLSALPSLQIVEDCNQIDLL